MMERKVISLIILAFLSTSAVAQASDLIFFTEAGDTFILYVNGEKINEEPLGKVKADGITGDFAQIKIDFDTPGAPTLTKGMMVDRHREMTTIIFKNRKGKYVLRPVSSNTKERENEKIILVDQHQAEPTHQVRTYPEAQEKISHEETGLGIKVKQDGFSVSLDVEGTFKDRIIHPENTQKRSPSQEQISARVVEKKILLSDGRTLDWKYTKPKSLTGVEIEMVQPVGAQVTVSYDGNIAYETEVPFHYKESDWKKSRAYFKLQVTEKNGNRWSVKLQHSSNYRILIENLQGGTSQQGVTNYTSACTGMSDTNFQSALESIKQKSFAEEKMIVAKQVAKSNCLYVDQVKQVLGVFSFEEDKLDFAKYAYDLTIDQNNYYRINDSFTYQESIEELDDFLESRN